MVSDGDELDRVSIHERPRRKAFINEGPREVIWRKSREPSIALDTGDAGADDRRKRTSLLACHFNIALKSGFVSEAFCGLPNKGVPIFKHQGATAILPPLVFGHGGQQRRFSRPGAHIQSLPTVRRPPSRHRILSLDLVVAEHEARHLRLAEIPLAVVRHQPKE